MKMNILFQIFLLMSIFPHANASKPVGKLSKPIITIVSNYPLDTTTANLRLYVDLADEITGLYFWKSNGHIQDDTLAGWKKPKDLLKTKDAVMMSAEAMSANEVKLSLKYATGEEDSANQPLFVTKAFFIRHSNEGFQVFDTKSKLVKKITVIVNTSWGVPKGISRLQTN